MRRFCAISALAATLVLGVAAVWMGGVNQDEGWYLYAANLVAEGKLPYRDFFFTQGPLMPLVYSFFAGIWRHYGLLGGRVFTLLLGLAGLGLFTAAAWRLASRRAAFVTFTLLAVNLYHLYYLAMPKTYALASLLVAAGAWLIVSALTSERGRAWRYGELAGAGFVLALSAGTRISLAAALPAAALALLVRRRGWRAALGLSLGGALGLALAYGPFVLDRFALDGLLAAQHYHTARGGSDLAWTIGSVSRLVRWYLPLFVLAGLIAVRSIAVGRAGVPSPAAVGGGTPTLPVNNSDAMVVLLAAFLAVFVLQLAAPFPYDDYQVPVMGLLAVVVAVVWSRQPGASPLMVLGMCGAVAFSSPLLERWGTNGQDRFWTQKKQQFELAQLRDVARRIERLDPGGRELLTQDLYLAVETNRKVPAGLEMGPFSQLDDAAWKRLLNETQIPLAAVSGYTFAVEPPVCAERPLARQMEYWGLLRERYALVDQEEAFGQNSTTLLILKRKEAVK